MADQCNLLAGLANHNMVNAWMVSPRAVFQSPEDQTEQFDMHECCMFVPSAIHLEDKTSVKRV
jgi:hypothetical protein